MRHGFQKNIKGGRDFQISVKQRYNEETTEYTSNEGIAILYFKDEDKMITTGGMSTENIERAMKHMMTTLINSYKEKNIDLSGVIEDCGNLLDSLCQITLEETGENGSVDDIN